MILPGRQFLGRTWRFCLRNAVLMLWLPGGVYHLLRRLLRRSDILIGRAHNGDPHDTREVSEEEKKRLWKEALEVIPLGRAQTPRDISWSTAFIASDYAREITGQCLCVDGGQTSGR